MQNRSILCSLVALAVLSMLPSSANAQLFELRTYTCNAGKLDALHARFRDHTMKLFEKHGIKNVGYWVPTNAPESENTLIYVIEHKDAESAKKSWAAFVADEDWKTAYKASTANGALVKKVESVYMASTDYSPSYDGDDSDATDAVFELRIYNTNEGKLDGLNARFRDHTMQLFDKHGITNVAYWTPTDEPESDSQLIYIIRHDSPDAAKASWKGFGSDPAWKKVAKESQKDGRFLSERPTSIYMAATEYSPMK